MGISIKSENSDKALANRLSDLRKSRGLSLDQAAELSGVSRATLSRAERGETSPTAHVLGRLSEAYCITWSVLLGGLDEAAPSVLPRNEANYWADPETGFQRWSISPPARGYDIELVLFEVPAGARLAYPPPAYSGMEKHILLLEGELKYEIGDTIYRLQANDTLRVKLYGETAIESCGSVAAKYLLAIRSSQ
jgi:transcriptional regulator with XRE-family HTH domain